MKYLILVALVFFAFGSCSKDDDKSSGVCYCDFANGEKQEYDLSDLPRAEQITECNRHSDNAALFGGVCKLE